MEDKKLKRSLENDKCIHENANSSTVRSIYPIDNILWAGNSQFCDNLIIAQSKEFERMLFTDGELQSTSYDEQIYHEFLVHPSLTLYYSIYGKKNINILILGGGEGATTRELLKYPTNIINKIVWIDIDKDLIQLSKTHLKYCNDSVYNDKRVCLSYEDANIFLNSTKETFDIIVCDLPDPWINENKGLYDDTFWKNLRRIVNQQHIIVSHVGPIQPGKKNFDFLQDLLKKIKLDISHCKLGKVFIPSFMSEWMYLYFNFTKPIQNQKINLNNLPQNLNIVDKDNIINFFDFPRYYQK